MEKELIMACVLISVSMVLKMWSIIALYHLSVASFEEERMHQDHEMIIIKKGQQVH